jgi:hypothetical protein
VNAAILLMIVVPFAVSISFSGCKKKEVTQAAPPAVISEPVAAPARDSESQPTPQASTLAVTETASPVPAVIQPSLA